MPFDKKITYILLKLSKSKFRSGFGLNAKDTEYIKKTGLSRIKSHAKDFIEKRLAPAKPRNDGRQTPFKGHPVFKAQHATATCCRSCLKKWHGIEKNRSLNKDEKEYILAIIMAWIKKEA